MVLRDDALGAAVGRGAGRGRGRHAVQERHAVERRRAGRARVPDPRVAGHERLLGAVVPDPEEQDAVAALAVDPAEVAADRGRGVAAREHTEVRRGQALERHHRRGVALHPVGHVVRHRLEDVDVDFTGDGRRHGQAELVRDEPVVDPVQAVVVEPVQDLGAAGEGRVVAVVAVGADVRPAAGRAVAGRDRGARKSVAELVIVLVEEHGPVQVDVERRAGQDAVERGRVAVVVDPVVQHFGVAGEGERLGVVAVERRLPGVAVYVHERQPVAVLVHGVVRDLARVRADGGVRVVAVGAVGHPPGRLRTVARGGEVAGVAVTVPVRVQVPVEVDHAVVRDAIAVVVLAVAQLGRAGVGGVGGVVAVTGAHRHPVAVGVGAQGVGRGGVAVVVLAVARGLGGARVDGVVRVVAVAAPGHQGRERVAVHVDEITARAVLIDPVVRVVHDAGADVGVAVVAVGGGEDSVPVRVHLAALVAGHAGGVGLVHLAVAVVVEAVALLDLVGVGERVVVVAVPSARREAVEVVVRVLAHVDRFVDHVVAVLVDVVAQLLGARVDGGVAVVAVVAAGRERQEAVVVPVLVGRVDAGRAGVVHEVDAVARGLVVGGRGVAADEGQERDQGTQVHGGSPDGAHYRPVEVNFNF